MAEFWVKVKVDPSGAQRGTKQVNRALGGVESRAKRLQGMLLRTFGALGLAAGAGLAIKSLADFGQEMATVQAISQATAAEFNQLRETAKELGATTRYSASQAAEGMKYLARSGFSVAEMGETVGATLTLAQSGALGLGEAASISANVLRGFRLEADEAGRVVDVLSLAANSANTDVRQLGDAMRFVAPVAAGVGIAIETTAASIGALSDAGLQASMAGTGLRRVLSTLEAPTANETKLLDALGVSAEEVRVSQVGLVQALQRLQDAGIDTGKALELFGDRGGPAFEVLVKNIPKIMELDASLQGAGGTAKRIADIMDKTLKGAMFAVTSAIEAVNIAFGDVGAETALTKFLFGLADTLRFLAKHMETTIHMTKALGIALAITFAPQLLGKAIFLVARLAEGIVFLSTKMAIFNTQAAISTVTMGKAKGAMIAFRIASTKLTTALKALWGVIMTNPLLALGAVVIAGAVFAFDQMNKKMAEAEAQQDRAHAKALQMIRARLREVQATVQANKNLAAYIETMERENRMLGLTIEKRREEEALTKALELAKRPLTDTEKQTILNLLEERKAIEARNKVKQEEANLLEEILGPQKEYAHMVKLLDSLLKQTLITDEQHAQKLRELQEAYGIIASDPMEDYLAQLRKENELLSMNEQEQELHRALLAARTVAQEELTDAQEEAVRALIAEKQALQDYNDEQEALNRLLYEVKGPAMDFAEQQRLLKILLDEGSISQAEFNKHLERMRELLGEGVDMTGLSAAMDTLKKQIKAAATDIEGLLVGAFHSAENAFLDFVQGGEDAWRNFFNQLLRDLMKLALNRLLMSLIGGAIGGAGGGAGGIVGQGVGANFSLGGQQYGGSFMVGGSGGPDSQMVAFRATPGEKVSVQRPGEAKREATQAASDVKLKIVNSIDPEFALDAMDSPQGERIVMNFIKKNPNTVRRLLGG